MEIICPHCKAPAHDTDYFCPACGKKLKDPPLSTTLMRQLVVYAIAIFLPPFGLIPAIKYLRGDSQKAKTIGVVAILLTVVVIFLTVVLTMQVISEATKVISSQQIDLQGTGLE